PPTRCFATQAKEMNLDNDETASRSIFAWDYVLWEVRLKVVAAGFLVYLGIILLAHCVSECMSVTYRSLPAQQKVFWCLAPARGLFGVQCCVAGFWALLLDPVFHADKVHSQKDWSWFHCLIGAGFFLLDNVALNASNVVFRTFDFVFVSHHFLSLAAFFGLITNIKSGHYITLMGMLLDMSAPSTWLGWMVLKAGWANTLFWKANQWVMIHSYHGRMVLTYHMWWVWISNWSAMLKNLGVLHFAAILTGLSAVTVIFNPYWTHKKTQQLFYPADWYFAHKASKNALSKKTE
ncbi:hypothetical protein lerEdw1_015479, partial [Lerista edwardsae]